MDWLEPGTRGRTLRPMSWQPSIPQPDFFAHVPPGTLIITTDYPREILGTEFYPVEIPELAAFAGAERLIQRKDFEPEEQTP